MGQNTTADGNYSIAMGRSTTASEDSSIAIGGYTEASATSSIAFGVFSENDISNSFTIGYGGPGGNDKVDFRVESEEVNVYGDLHVSGTIYGELADGGSSFYDKDSYGRALDYLVDSSKTVKLNAEGEKEYNHEADPIFLQKWVTVKDYDKYTEEEVWIEELNETITRRIYETHQELRSNESMKIAWLRQSVFELKQENQMLKDEIARLKEAVGIE